MLSLDGFQIWALEDLALLAVVLLISYKEDHEKLFVSNLFSYLLYSWSLVSLQCGSKYWKLRCVDWRKRLLGMH